MSDLDVREIVELNLEIDSEAIVEDITETFDGIETEVEAVKMDHQRQVAISSGIEKVAVVHWSDETDSVHITVLKPAVEYEVV